MSADIISKHLIFPFISVSHLAFSSPDAINTMSDADLEKVPSFTVLIEHFIILAARPSIRSDERHDGLWIHISRMRSAKLAWCRPFGA